jgi:hypothetical protein
MKYNIKNHIWKQLFGLVIVMFFLFASCVKEIDHPIAAKAENALVVEAILTNEMKRQRIRLSLSNTHQNQEVLPVKGASVTVSCSSGEQSFEEDEENAGSYLSALPFAASISDTYILKINYNGQNYTAFSQMSAVSSYNPIHYEKLQNDLYHLSNPTSSFTIDEQAMYELNIIWQSGTDSTIHVKTYRYQLNTLDVSIVFSPEEESIYFPEGAMIIGKKYSLTQDYAGYIRAMLAETHWQGGLFDDEKANLPTNISNGGLGYFTACSVRTDTIIVK